MHFTDDRSNCSLFILSLFSWSTDSVQLYSVYDVGANHFLNGLMRLAGLIDINVIPERLGGAGKDVYYM